MNFHLRRLPSLLAGSLLAIGLLTGPVAQGQLIQGGIDGLVTDSTEAAIVGAEVTITNEATGQVRSTSTGVAGNYSFPTVNTGSYSVSVRSEGFQASTTTGVVVSQNNITRVNAQLEIGQVTEVVTVEASAATLQTDRAEVRQEVTEKTLRNVPVPLGRNYQMLFVTLPGFSPPQNAHSVPTNPSRAVRFSVNGTSRSNNNTRIDGASSTNIWVPHMTGYNPALESIETVNVVTNSFDAEQGLAGGAAINLQIKSGGNDVHGSAFEYHMNQHLKAYPYFSNRNSPKPKYINNQFGGTIGGPIKRNKWFYFVSYEGTREAQFAQRFIDMPTQAMRFGDLTGSPTPIYDPLSGDQDQNGSAYARDRQPFPGNMIPMSRIDEGVANMIHDSAFPSPNQAGVGSLGLSQNYRADGSTTFFRDTVDAKTNFNLTDNTTGFIRFSFLDYRMSNGQTLGQFGGNRLHPTNSNPGTGFGNTYSGTISLTHVVSPNFLIDGYYGYTLVDTNVEQQRLDENLGWSVLGVPGLQSDRFIDGGWPRLRIDGFEGLGMSNSFMPYYRSDPQNQFVFNGNWTTGTHNIRFGTDVYLQDLDHNQPEFSGGTGAASGEFRFRQNTTELRGGPSGNDYNAHAAWLLGMPQLAGKIWQFNENGYFTRTRMYTFYIRDRWQVTPRLTLSYGVRYENFPFPTRATRGLERYDFDHDTLWACGVGSIPTNCGIDIGTNNFVPRVGLAYRVTDDTVVRVGYGVTVDPFNWARPLRTNYPIMAKDGPPLLHSFGFATTLRQGIDVITEPDLGDGVLRMPSNTVVRTMDTNNLTRGYIQSWNFTLERRFGDWIATAGYVATRSVNQLAGLEQNWGDIGEGNAGRQLVKKFGRAAGTTLFGSLGTAKYDSLQTKLQRRFRNGFQMNLAYTWAHGRGFTDEDSGDGPGFFRIPRLYHRTYGDLNQDIRHNFQMTAIYELPFGPGKSMLTNSPLGKILGGWQFNGLWSSYTGTPFSVLANSGDLNAAGSSQIADCLSEPNYVKQGGNALWIDPGAFAQPTGPRFGTCGPNNVRGPGLVNIDLGVFRKFQITEKMNLEFRAEGFNMSNTPHFERPNGRNVRSGNFMILNRIRNTGREGIDERFFRVGLRLGW
ncbi:MAG: TonB-dependent receptor [Bryobacterales bacterium]|nr:TonB-dependent receptor [Bryobacterales bacterium]